MPPNDCFCPSSRAVQIIAPVGFPDAAVPGSRLDAFARRREAIKASTFGQLRLKGASSVPKPAGHFALSEKRSCPSAW